MQMRRVVRRTLGAAWAAMGFATLCLALASCGGASAATNGAGAATATCPPTTAAQANFKVVSGKITSAGTGSISVSPSSGGGNVTVQIASTTRISTLANSSLSAVQVGDVAQVTPDATGTIAQRIIVQNAGSFGRGGTSGRQPSATRTPGARFNSACARRAGAGNGGFGAADGQGQGGRVSEISSSQIVLTDAQGQALTYSVTANTVIITPKAGSAADLKAGAMVMVTGQATGSTISARSIVVTSAAQ